MKYAPDGLDLASHIDAVDVRQGILGEIGIGCRSLTVKESGHGNGGCSVTEEFVTIPGFVKI